MPHITAAQHAQHLAELERLTAKGYTINATLTGYSVKFGALIIVSAQSKEHPPEVHAEQFGRNFLSAALTIAREHAGEVTKDHTPELESMSFSPSDLRLLREGLLELLESFRGKRVRDLQEEQRIQALYLRFT